jgi:hypothetical protein
MEQSLSEVHVVQGAGGAGPLELPPPELLLLELELLLLLLLALNVGVGGTIQSIGKPIGSSMASGVPIEASSFALKGAQSPWVIAGAVPHAAAVATTKTQPCTIPRALNLMLPFLVFRSDPPVNHTRI